MPAKQPGSVFYLGGCRSGKSRLAEEFVVSNFSRPCYVATMTRGQDVELHDRIDIHQKRRGDCWQLIEEPRDLGRILSAPNDADVVLIDCLTMWLTNLLLADLSDDDIRKVVTEFVQAISCCQVTVVLVANEVGLGIVPDSSLGRRFRDLAGWLNQQVAEVCQRVIFVAAGLPLILKDR
ncbi:MAG: bifunctional adenosylcobinamide kinase/adenosylcobinamide-phosphate guanylyltransferase [Proteobacteria bacterium]|nr:bifunctional adenosylcobinamide kinase/adenosylcobinamide-phosphate guanylyltransferase [Pseudomonadota bacterium]MBU1639574.1 bifunctional adenosylcobinamide kinase/adenosylcobinamide-phosphate guanylyltransferase [Pseudomonadota bacterium]